MPDVANLQIEIDSKQVKAAIGVLSQLERQGGKVESRFTTIGRQAQRTGRQLSTWLTAPILGAGAVAVKTAADYETLQTQLEVLVGSAEVANQVFGDLTEFAATTPFEIDGIVRANNLLLGFGVSIEQTQDLLGTLGDIAAVSGGDLFSLARITGEARAENKLLTRDLRQLIAQGVPAIQLLADSLGVAESQIFDLASAGEIGFQELIDAFEMATSAGGLFFEGMEKRSNTLSGIFSNAMDSINQSLASVGQTIVDVLDIKGVTRDLIDNLDRATEWFDNLDESSQRMIITFAGVLAAIGPLIGILGTLSLAIGAISGPVAAVAAAVALGTTAIIKNWEEVEAYFTTGGGAQVWKDLRGIVDETIRLVTGFWDTFGDDIISITEGAFGRVLSIVEFTLDKIHNLMKAFNGNFKGELNIWEDNVITTAAKVDNILTGTIMRALFRTGEAFSSVFGDAAKDSKQAAETTMEDWLRVEKFIQDSLFLTQDWKFPEPANIKDTTDAVEKFVASIQGVSLPSMSFGGTENIENWSTVTQKALDDIDRKFRTIEVSSRVFSDFDENTAKVQVVEEQLRSLIENGVNPNSAGMVKLIQLYNKLKNEGGDAVDNLEDGLEETNKLAQDLGFTFSSAFEDSIVAIARTEDALESLKRITQGVLEDILRITTRTLVTGPLSDALTGALTGISGAESVDDLIISDTGRVFKPSPDDTIMAIKNLDSLGGRQTTNVSTPVNVTINNQTDSQVDVQESRGPGGEREVEVFVRNAVRGLMNSGQLDRTMSQNYGVRRRGQNYG